MGAVNEKTIRGHGLFPFVWVLELDLLKQDWWYEVTHGFMECKRQ